MNDELDTAINALDHIPPYDYETWYRVGAALYSEFGESAHDAFINWSAGADSFAERDAEAKWKSFRGMKRVNIATLFYHAKLGGYVPGPRKHIDPAELARRKAEREAALAKFEAEERQRHELKSREAMALLRLTNPATDDLGYLQRKSVKAHRPLRSGPWTIHFQDATGAWQNATIPGCGLVPMLDADRKLWGIQALLPQKDDRLTPARDKDYLTGCRKRGTYCPIGTPKGRMYICEGFATGSSIHEATGHAVAVAFDVGNLMSVAQALRAKYPTIEMVIACDNDQFTKGNPGLIKALEAAQAVGAKLAIPEFTQEGISA